MRCSWLQHVEVARALADATADQQGEALALMGAALLMLAQDLLLQESPLGVTCD